MVQEEVKQKILKINPLLNPFCWRATVSTTELKKWDFPSC